VKFKIVEEFIDYAKSNWYEGIYSIEKNPAKWQLPTRAWINEDGDIYVVWPDEKESGGKPLIHQYMLDILKSKNIAKEVPNGWETVEITDWVCVYVRQSKVVYIGESYRKLDAKSLENVKNIFKNAKKKNPSLTFRARKFSGWNSLQ